MSMASQFLGGGATTAVINGFSSGGNFASGSVAANAGANGARELLSGALTANTLATLLSLTGSGHIPFLSAYSKDTTSRTVRLQVTVDGVVVFDATSGAIATTSIGIVAAGCQPAAGGGWVDGDPIRFSASCVIRVASSLTETDKVAIAYKVN